MSRQRTNADHARSSGFTLIEMVSSLVIVSLLLGAMGSLVMLASKATPRATDHASATRESQLAFDIMAMDLVAAIEVIEAKPTSIKIKVADRTGDSVPETIEYAWSGTAGDPFTMKVNADSPRTLVARVETCGLEYQAVTEATQVQVGTSPTTNYKLAGYTHGGTPDLDNMILGDQVAQTVYPTLPADTVSYDITLVKLYGEATSLVNGRLAVDIRSGQFTGLLPSSTLYQSTVIDEANLTGNTASNAIFNVTGLNPKNPISIVVRYNFGTLDAGNLRYATSTPADQSSGYATYLLAVWTPQANQSLIYEMFGTIHRPKYEAGAIARLDSLRVKVKSLLEMETTLRTPARPVLPNGTTHTVVGALN